MNKNSVYGYINSIQSMGAVDGPGIRFVAFLQGCPLRCKCCHNPDTWAFSVGDKFSAEELFNRAIRFKEYFGKDGGVTLSGGEPIMQAEFALEYFRLCHEHSINTCLDTSGCILDQKVKNLLEFTDRVLLDIKYLTDELYKENVGCSLQSALDFLGYLNEKNIPTTLRQVIIPTVNDSDCYVKELVDLAKAHPCVDKIELLPFRKICSVKYDNLKIPFPFADLPEPTHEKMQELETLLENYK